MEDSVGPNFFIIGAPKAGSTTLWHELRKHPDVFMPEEKEPRFFLKDRSNVERRAYLALFEEGKESEAIGEATPGYSKVLPRPDTPRRIAAQVPNARLIYIVRHPLRRMESSWRQNVYRGRLPHDTFNDAIRRYRPLVESSLYFECIKAYRQHFPDEQMLVVFLEDLAQQPNRVLNDCFEFLGVDRMAGHLKQDARQNASKNGLCYMCMAYVSHR